MPTGRTYRIAIWFPLKYRTTIQPDGERREGSAGEVDDGLEIPLRQAATDDGAGLAAGVPEEDSRPVAIEQDHRMLDEAGQDQLEIEPAADVTRDTSQGIGPMESMRDLVRSAGGRGDDADRRRGLDQEVRVDRSPVVARDVGDVLGRLEPAFNLQAGDSQLDQ